MSNALVLFLSYPDYYNDIDSNVAVASGGQFEVSNLLTQNPSHIWRSSTDAVNQISGNFGTGQTINTFVLWNHNISAAGDIRLQLWDGAAEDFDTTWQDTHAEAGWSAESLMGVPNNHTVVNFADEVDIDSWRVTIDDTTNISEFLQAGRILLGNAFQTTIVNADVGHSFGWEDSSERRRLVNGNTVITRQGISRRRGILTWSALEESEAEQIWEQIAWAGQRKTILVNPFPDSTTNFAKSRRFLARLEDDVDVFDEEGQLYSISVAYREEI